MQIANRGLAIGIHPNVYTLAYAGQLGAVAYQVQTRPDGIQGLGHSIPIALD